MAHWSSVVLLKATHLGRGHCSNWKELSAFMPSLFYLLPTQAPQQWQMKTVHFAFYVCVHVYTASSEWKYIEFCSAPLDGELSHWQSLTPARAPSTALAPCDKAESVQGAPVTQETLFHHDFLSIQPQHHPTRQTFHPYCPCLTSSILPITRGKLFWRRGPPSQVYQQLNFGIQPITAGSISGKHC